MESIRIWLNGARNYSSGIMLYQKLGNDQLLKRLFSEKEVTDYKVKKLTEVLEAMLYKEAGPDQDDTDPSSETPTKNSEGQDKPQTIIFGTTGWSKQMDATEKELFDKWKPLFSEMNELCAKVGDLAREGQTDPYKEIAAGQMALRILRLEDECYDLYDERNYYLDHGQLPEARPYGEVCIDALLIPKKLETHKRYLRDYKNKLEKNPDDVNAKEQLIKQQWFIDYYKKVLNL